jgi:hypothetical protein
VAIRIPTGEICTRDHNIVRACTYERLTAVLIFSAVAVAAALSPMQTDTWWQLRAGADIVGSRHVLLTDIYSHTAYGAAWPNHEWLSQVVFFGVYALGGLPLLTLLTTALIVAAWILVWRLCDGTGSVRLIVVAASLLPASLHWEPRPHAFSLLFLIATVTLVIAERSIWLPLLFLIWANCHGGVALGFVVLGAAFASELVDCPREWRRFAAIVAACAMTTTMTPLGVSFWTEIPKSLARIQQYAIDEWQPPAITDVRLVPFWIAAVLLCSGVALDLGTLFERGRRKTRLLCGCALAALPFAVSAIRNVGPFLMLAAPAICGLLAPRFAGHALPRRDERVRINAAVIAVAAALVVIVVATAYRRQIPHLRWTPLPAASLQVLRRCPDNLYNRFDEGGYLIWFAPERRVFLDGRQDPYPPKLIHEQVRVEGSGDYASTFDRYQIRCAYLPTSSPVASRLASAGWTTLYRDRDWIVLTITDQETARASGR